MLLGGKVIQVYGRSQQSLRGGLELRGWKSQVPHPLYETLVYNIIIERVVLPVISLIPRLHIEQLGGA